MFALTSTRLALQAQKVAQQGRHMSVISGPPQVKISFAEKVAHGLFIVAGMTAIPIWVLVNIKNYRKSE